MRARSAEKKVTINVDEDIHRRAKEAGPLVCPCWRECPNCGARMDRYAEPVDPKRYGGPLDAYGVRVENRFGQVPTLDTYAKCPACGWLSEVKPMEVELG